MSVTNENRNLFSLKQVHVYKRNSQWLIVNLFTGSRPSRRSASCWWYWCYWCYWPCEKRIKKGRASCNMANHKLAWQSAVPPWNIRQSAKTELSQLELTKVIFPLLIFGHRMSKLLVSTTVKQKEWILSPGTYLCSVTTGLTCCLPGKLVDRLGSPVLRQQ